MRINEWRLFIGWLLWGRVPQIFRTKSILAQRDGTWLPWRPWCLDCGRLLSSHGRDHGIPRAIGLKPMGFWGGVSYDQPQQPMLVVWCGCYMPIFEGSMKFSNAVEISRWWNHVVAHDTSQSVARFISDWCHLVVWQRYHFPHAYFNLCSIPGMRLAIRLVMCAALKQIRPPLFSTATFAPRQDW